MLLDGEPVRSCLLFAVMSEGHEVTTIEGLTPTDGTLSALQRSFRECHAMHYGYCTPAMIVAAHGLLTRNPKPTREQIREALSANLCRCVGYLQIIEAVERAAEELGA